MADLPTSTDVVVIGGGIMGTSTAYHLAEAGVDVVLVERDTIASGSTSKSAGGFRAQFSDELNIAMAVENIDRLSRFGEELGVDIDFRQWGYLFLLKASELDGFGRALELQHTYGVPSTLMTPEEAREMVPGLVIEDLAAATFCPIDGYCTPEAVAQGYAVGAANRGARIVQSCEVLEIVTEGDAIIGVRTNRGPISTPEIVLTAGAWSRAIAGQVGLDLPVKAEVRHVWVTGPGDALPHQLPNVIDFSSGLYFHREGDGVLMGGREPTLEELAEVISVRIPSLLDLEVRHTWSGLYEVSPDHNALVGTFEGVRMLHYATGFSGHGFQQGPVIGEHLAQLVLGETPTFDLARLSAGRFESGITVPEAHVV